MPPPNPHRRSPPVTEDAIAEFVWIVTHYEWSRQELKECGVREEEFKRLVRLLRFALVASGFVVV